jgi:hypothetical protein
MTQRKLWEVDDGGATYWVTALDDAEAIALVKAIEDVDEYDGFPLTATELDINEARARTFKFEDGDTCKLSNVFELLGTYSEVLACSEWP